MYNLTIEQQACVQGAITGQDVKTKAFAGSGKTSTLVAISKALGDKRILYLAYNNSIKKEAENKFPDNVDCKTAHSLAFCRYIHIIGCRVSDDSPKLNTEALIKHIGIRKLHDCEQEELATKALRILRRFVQSSYSLSYLNPKPLKGYQDEDERKEAEIDRYIEEIAYDYWDRCTKKDSDLPINHDVYLKMYQLSNPDLSRMYDVILFDECQDANPVLLDIVSKQKCQKIYVGDEHQQIYSWRGAINAFDELDGEEFHLNQSFRFGEKIATLSNMILTIKGEKRKLKGFNNLDTQIVYKACFPYTSLCKTNNKAIEVILNNLDRSVHLVGNNIKSIVFFLNSGLALYKNNLKLIKHDLLKGFRSWDHMLKEHEKSEEKDSNLSLLINFVEKYNNDLVGTLEKLRNVSDVKEKEADLIISTIHKAKGREWNNVVVEDDFKLSEKTSDEEWNLLYVAITRAEKTLCLRGNLLQDLTNIFYNQ
jgi:superfamily I DNA/RNA helicase